MNYFSEWKAIEKVYDLMDWVYEGWFMSLRHRESLSAIGSMMDVYDLITRRGILSSNLSRQSSDGSSWAARQWQ
jgi:hypothetical protein